MDKSKLKQLLKQEEGPKLDFKAKLSLINESEKKELTKDVIAMANTRGGRGYILFGVEDKTKRILGVDPGDFKEEQIQQLIYNRCDPPVPISVEFIEYEEKLLVILTVYRSSFQPHQMLQNGAFYIRRGSTTDTARRSEIANLLQENGLMTYETVTLRNVDVSELNLDLIRQYFQNLNVMSDKPSDVLLEAVGILGQCDDEGYHPTIGGLLLFGNNPSLFLPHIYVKVSYNDDIQYFYGNILKMLDQACDYIEKVIVEEDYPLEEVYEALANALVHRDYLDNSRGITVTINEKNIEVSNPGSLIASNSIYKFIKENNPDRRNSWLYQRLVTLDVKKRFMKSGTGMKRIKESFEQIGEVKFLNIGSQNLFKVILPRRIVK
ncbi:MAG: putative transcriptional regulator [Clostridiales bacterium]|jgi:predicted HTH transcriptional regulator|nr:putative transcriptional regulator [Clostridiales bacterium]